MKRQFSGFVLVLLLALSNTADAAMYKGVDEKGNVVFSDQPFESGKRFTPPPISVTRQLDNEPEETNEEGVPTKEFRYLAFDIVSPRNMQAIEVGSDVMVNLNLKPGLNEAQGHTISILINGSPVVEGTSDTTIELGELKLGDHRLQAVIKDTEGNIVVRTRMKVIVIQTDTDLRDLSPSR